MIESQHLSASPDFASVTAWAACPESAPECGLEPILLCCRVGVQSLGHPPGEKLTDPGDPSMTSNSPSFALTSLSRGGVACTSLACEQFRQTAPQVPSQLAQGRAIVHRDCRRLCPVSVLAVRYEPSCPPDECERQGARALTSTSGAANSHAKHHRANGYYYNSPTTAMERQLRNQRAYERGEYYEHDSNALPFGSRACWEQKCARAPTNAEQSGPEKERSKTISRIVQSYLFRLRLTSAQAFFGLSHSRGSAKASNRLLRATCDVVRHNHLAARDG